MTVTLTTSNAVILKAGFGVADELINGITVGGESASNAIVEFINEAEGHVCVESRYNWVDNYSGLDKNVRKLLDEATSNLAAIYAINYDMTNYFSRQDAETKLDILWNNYREAIRLLKENNNVTYIQGA